MRLLAGIILSTFLITAVGRTQPLSPTAVVASADGSTLYVACATANRVLRVDAGNGGVSGSCIVPKSPQGLALSTDGKRLFVTCAAATSQVCVIDTEKLEIIERIQAGHTAMGSVLSSDGKTLYVCNRFNHDVSAIDLVLKTERFRVPVQREPVAAAITKDGKRLLVANHLPSGRADSNYIAAVVSVIDTDAGKVIKEVLLPTGSGSLNDIGVSPDGRYAVVTHIVGRFSRLSSHVNDGWINANAVTVIDLAGMRVYGTMLLDGNYRGAANPWGIAWLGENLVVAHAGTHEVSVIDFRSMLANLPARPADYDPVKAASEFAVSRSKQELPDDLPFFAGTRVRVKLDDFGPRAAIASGGRVYIANYFSDTISAISLNSGAPKVESIALGAKRPMDAVRKGEFYFNDARICFERWQSCASCHPGGGRVDGLNWDLLNDGVGNPKNTRSLLLSVRTPPSMSLGVRANAEAAVRAGIEHILFAKRPDDEVVNSILAYLQSLKPIPSPLLVNGMLSESAQRGEKVFAKAKCAECHVPGLYTDGRAHDVGTRGAQDRLGDKFYTPTLIEVWRTAPYFHDGSVPTLVDVLKSRNSGDRHGITSSLTPRELDDLGAFVLSL